MRDILTSIRNTCGNLSVFIPVNFLKIPFTKHCCASTLSVISTKCVLLLLMVTSINFLLIISIPSPINWFIKLRANALTCYEIIALILRKSMKSNLENLYITIWICMWKGIFNKQFWWNPWPMIRQYTGFNRQWFLTELFSKLRIIEVKNCALMKTQVAVVQSMNFFSHNIFEGLKKALLKLAKSQGLFRDDGNLIKL